MKVKTTRKQITNSTPRKYLKKAGYCDLQDLLVNHTPVAYTCGVYGWNFDVYEVYGLTICTGYRGMPGDRLDDIGKYNDKARAVLSDTDTEFEKRSKKVEKLLKEFCVKNGGSL